MTSPERHAIELEPGFRSREVALFVAMVEDLTRRLLADSEDLTPAELERQPAPGMNSIGMLFAHLAYYEVFWVRSVLEDRPAPIEVRDVLGIGRADMGVPLSPGARPPAALAGRDIAYFHDLLSRARAYTYQVARSVADAELERDVERPRQEGDRARFTPRWALYHLLEHLAGHYGQIQVLKRLHRACASA